MGGIFDWIKDGGYIPHKEKRKAEKAKANVHATTNLVGRTLVPEPAGNHFGGPSSGPNSGPQPMTPPPPNPVVGGPSFGGRRPPVPPGGNPFAAQAAQVGLTDYQTPQMRMQAEALRRMQNG